MKNLTIAAAAACAASTAVSSTTTVPMTKHVRRWIGNSIPRGGDGQNNDNIDNTSSNKSKKSSTPHRSGSKKKKSTKTKQEKEKTDTTTQAKNNKDNNNNNNNPVIEEILQHEDFYDVLGVTNTASERDIQKAYRKRCVQTHPDKTGGDRRAFDKVAEAYDVLSEPSKRQVYNRYGKAGLDPSNSGIGAGDFGGDGGASSMFRSMFQQAAQNQQQRQRRNQSLRYQLEVTLEDLYYGRTQRVQVAPPHSPFHQQQRRRKEVEVHISKGSVNGQSVILSGEVDFNDDNSPPGDLVFILTQAPHATFTRKENDLALALTICLEEAVCGLKRPIKHLDGTEMWIESANYSDDHSSTNNDKNKLNQDKNYVIDDDDDDNGKSRNIPIMIRTGDVQVLKGRGMPKRNTSDEFGDLYIQYRVEMPKSKNGKALTEEEFMELSRLLTKLEDGGNDRRRKQSKSRRQNSDEQHQAKIKQKIYALKEAKSSNFGTASGKVVWEEEDGIGGGNGDEFHSFASSHFQRGSSASGFFGSNPFGGMGGLDPNGGNDEGNVQCQQM